MILLEVLKLSRWKNLLILAFTLVLFKYGVEDHLRPEKIMLSGHFFYLILCSILLICAAGNIINDYFDRGIDAINNRSRILVNKGPKQLVNWLYLYAILNVVALLLAFHVCKALHNMQVFGLILSAIIFLFLYAFRLKKMLLVGNMLVALLSALSILCLAFFESIAIIQYAAYVFAGFAFLTTLLREYIKDVEDREGDRAFGVQSVVNVFGLSRSKYYAYAVLSSIVISLNYIAYILLQHRLYFAFCYVLFLLILPYVAMFYMIHKASTKLHFNQLSSYSKVLMLLGVLSILLLYFS